MIKFNNIVCFIVAISAHITLLTYSASAKSHIEALKAENQTQEKYRYVDLEGASDVCEQASKNLDTSTGYLSESVKWENVEPQLLKYPKEYSGYIKYLNVDIDNDGFTENLVKAPSYLGGTLTAVELYLLPSKTLDEPLISIESIMKNSLFNIKREGKKQFLKKFNNLRSEGQNTYSNPDFSYGFSVYAMQNKFVEVFTYEKKNFILLNNFLDAHRPIGNRVGLVLEITGSANTGYRLIEKCFFKIND